MVDVTDGGGGDVGPRQVRRRGNEREGADATGAAAGNTTGGVTARASHVVDSRSIGDADGANARRSHRQRIENGEGQWRSQSG